MRYEVRKNNGVFHVFDTFLYKAVDAYDVQEAAERHARSLNLR